MIEIHGNKRYTLSVFVLTLCRLFKKKIEYGTNA